MIFSKRAQNVPNQNSQNQDVFLRLNNEVKQSIEAAEALLDVVDHNKLSVHVDLSSRKKDMSNKIHSMAMGWVSGLSLTALAKPDSWAASAVAHGGPTFLPELPDAAALPGARPGLCGR